MFGTQRFGSLAAFNVAAMAAWFLIMATPGRGAANGQPLPGMQSNRSAMVPVPDRRATGTSATSVASLRPSTRPYDAGEADLEHNPSLDAVRRYAIEHNPAIRAASFAWRAARQRITEERSYQNPMVTYMPDTGNMAQTRAGPQTNGLSISQTIPFPGKLGLRGKVADLKAQAANEKIAAVTQETLRRIWIAYAQFYFAERALEVNTASTVLARQFEAVAEAKYKVAKVPEQDVIQAQAELSRFAAERVDFIQQRTTAIGALNTLLDRAPGAPLGRPLEMAARKLKVPLEKLIDAGREARPEIRAENHLVQARERSVTLAKMGYLPDLSIGVQYMGIDGHSGVRGFTRNGHDVWAATIGFSVPIWLDRVTARVDETGAELQQEKFERRNVEDTVNDQIQRAYERVIAAARNEAIYRTTLLPQTAERIRAAQAGYQTGTVDFLTLIDSLKSYESVRLLRYRSILAYQTAAADLTRAVGEPIPGIVK